MISDVRCDTAPGKLADGARKKKFSVLAGFYREGPSRLGQGHSDLSLPFTEVRSHGAGAAGAGILPEHGAC